jgi:hypothetical protein
MLGAERDAFVLSSRCTRKKGDAIFVQWHSTISVLVFAYVGDDVRYQRTPRWLTTLFTFFFKHKVLQRGNLKLIATYLQGPGEARKTEERKCYFELNFISQGTQTFNYVSKEITSFEIY